MSREMGAPTLANMIITGKLMAACPEISNAFLKEGLHKCVSARHQDLYELNLKAIKAGEEY